MSLKHSDVWNIPHSFQAKQLQWSFKVNLTADSTVHFKCLSRLKHYRPYNYAPPSCCRTERTTPEIGPNLRNARYIANTLQATDLQTQITFVLKLWGTPVGPRGRLGINGICRLCCFGEQGFTDCVGRVSTWQPSMTNDWKIATSHGQPARKSRHPARFAWSNSRNDSVKVEMAEWKGWTSVGSASNQRHRRWRDVEPTTRIWV